MKLSKLLVLAALLVPSAALAQIAVTNATGTAETTGSTFAFHRGACDEALQGNLNTYNDFQLQWPLSVGGQVTYQAFWSTDPSCGSAAATDGGNNSIPISSTGTANEITVNGETIVSQATGLASPCDATPPVSGTVYICITGSEFVSGGFVGSTGTQQLAPFDIAFQYDMSPPPAPSGFTVSPADSELDCNWGFPYTAPPVTIGDTGAIPDTGNNADHFVIYYQEDDALTPDFMGTCTGDGGVPDGGTAATVDPTGWANQLTVQSPSSDVDSSPVPGLTNGHCYDVAIIAFYQDGTQGLPSPVLSAAPIEIFDYWRLYHSAGGADQGGAHCQSAGGGLVPLALAAALLLVMRRRRRRSQATPSDGRVG